MNLKERVYKVLLERPLSKAELAREIGLNQVTMSFFMNNDNHVLSFKNKLLIEKWLRKQENQL